MSAQLRKKVIEAGIVPAQAIKLLSMWRMLDEDETMWAADKQERTENELLEFVSQIGQLLEAESSLPEIRESVLEVNQVLIDQQGQQCTLFVVSYGRLVAYQRVVTLEDSHGCFWFSVSDSTFVEAGNIIRLNDEFKMITDTMKVYAGEQAHFIRCQVTGVAPDDLRVLEEDYAKMSGMPQLRQGT